MQRRLAPARLGAAVILAVSATISGFADSPSAGREGSRLRDPPQLVSHNGVLRVRLVVERRRVHVGGRKLWALTYNGHYMPPTLRIRPGDRLDLAMQNRLGASTNLHVHGWHVSPTGNSDNVIYVHIQPGQTFHYSYRFPGNLAPGTYWYHSHEDPISAPQVAGGCRALSSSTG
jgi:suppressor of ftsI